MKAIIENNSGTREYDFGNNRSAYLAADLYGWAEWNEKVYVTTNKGIIKDLVIWIPGEGYKRVFAVENYKENIK